MYRPAWGTFVQNAVYLYLTALLLELVAAGLWMSRGARDYGLPEWLINYHAGFIRRGLTGAILGLVSEVTHLSPLLLAALAGICCYAVLFLVFARLLRRSSWQWWVYGLALSPATLAFPVISRTSFRKDVLFLAFLAAVVASLQRRTSVSRDFLPGATLAVALPVMVLCQEPLFVYFPYIVAAVLIFTGSVRRTLLICTVPVVLSSLALAAVSKDRGTPEQVRIICASAGAANLSSCPAGIRIAGAPPLDVPAAIREFGYWKHYGMDLLLAIIPVVGGFYALRGCERSATRVLLGAAAISAIGSTSLFAYGIDWGRWINLHIISLALLLLAIHTKNAVTEQTSAAQLTKVRRVLATGVCVIYATCWSMPGNRDRPLFGYLSLGQKLIHWRGSFTD